MNSQLDRQQRELIAMLKENGASLVGFGDISDISSRLTFGFPTAISLAVHYDNEVGNTVHID